MSSFKSVLALFLTAVLVISSVKAYFYFKSPKSAQSMPQTIQRAKDDAQKAIEQAQKVTEPIKHRKPLKDIPSVQVGSVFTPEVVEELQKRESDDLAAISALEVGIAKQSQVIQAQDQYIIHLKREIWIVKVIAGVLIVVAVVVLL